jgi:hypothetical protein
VGDAFGARLIAATGAHGHTGYFRPGTGSLSSFAAIGTGNYAAVR